MKKLARSRPGCPSVGSAMSMFVSPIEMSKWPASSNTVQWGLVSSRGSSFVGRVQSSDVRPANTSWTRPNSVSSVVSASSYVGIGVTFLALRGASAPFARYRSQTAGLPRVAAPGRA